MSDTGKELRMAKLSSFCNSREFQVLLANLVSELVMSIDIEKGLYGESFTYRGLPRLVSDIDRKTNRIYKKVFEDSTGRNTLAHDLDDLLHYTVYTILYYRMCVKHGILAKPEIEDSITKQVYEMSSGLLNCWMPDGWRPVTEDELHCMAVERAHSKKARKRGRNVRS